MALVDLWKTNADELRKKSIQQLLAVAGDGRLRDDNETSQEFRKFLRHVPSDLLVQYANQCLTTGFPQSGLVLQDLVNEMGRRLGFKVEEGRYQGTGTVVGFDGLWRSEDDRTILVEVKTTDAFRLNLETTSGYRRRLLGEGKLREERSSILYVVGRDDTGGFEAQVRGSRYAWDIRIISVDALLRLLKVKEELEDRSTLDRIRNILTPREYTRVDGIIDLVFTAARDIKQEEEIETQPEVDQDPTTRAEKKFTPVNYRDACIERLQAHLGETLVKQTYAIFANPDDTLGVLCAISKEYRRPGRVGYWFGFDRSQKETLSEYQKALVAFGCGSEKQIIVIPFDKFVEWLPQFNTTESDDRFYWHVHIRQQAGKFILETKQEFKNIDISDYLLKSVA
jgi:hypothetical protein